MPDLRAQFLALRQFTVGFYASILVARPGPVSAAQRIAQDDVSRFQKLFETGAIPDASPQLIETSIHQLELIWNDVEQALRLRGYSA